MAESNRAAGIATAARLKASGEAPKPLSPRGSGGARVAAPALPVASKPVSKESWTCAECLNVNLWFRDSCNRCHRANPSRAAGAARGTQRDVTQCTAEEVQAYIEERQHLTLQPLFEAAGLPLVEVRCRTGVG